MMLKNQIGWPYQRFDCILLGKEEGLTGFSQAKAVDLKPWQGIPTVRKE